jgi:hypothetical protein
MKGKLNQGRADIFFVATFSPAYNRVTHNRRVT